MKENPKNKQEVEKIVTNLVKELKILMPFKITWHVKQNNE